MSVTDHIFAINSEVLHSHRIVVYDLQQICVRFFQVLENHQSYEDAYNIKQHYKNSYLFFVKESLFR